MEKVYADKHGHAVFQCPHCRFQTNFDASGYRDRDSRIRIKCRCGKNVLMLVEFREFYRRPVKLFGWCRVHRTEANLEIRLHDLSMSGLSFSLESEVNEEEPPIVVGDVLTIQFRLDCPPIILFSDGQKCAMSAKVPSVSVFQRVSMTRNSAFIFCDDPVRRD